MQVIKDGLANAFLKDLPHVFYDENILHSLLISEIKDYSECIRQVDVFLPYVDNWAVCDIIAPKVFKEKQARTDWKNQGMVKRQANIYLPVRPWDLNVPLFRPRFR